MTITAGGRTLVRDVASGDSFLSTHDPRPHFGLGSTATVDQVDVRWPDGTHSVRHEGRGAAVPDGEAGRQALNGERQTPNAERQTPEAERRTTRAQRLNV